MMRKKEWNWMYEWINKAMKQWEICTVKCECGYKWAQKSNLQQIDTIVPRSSFVILSSFILFALAVLKEWKKIYKWTPDENLLIFECIKIVHFNQKVLKNSI